MLPKTKRPAATLAGAGGRAGINSGEPEHAEDTVPEPDLQHRAARRLSRRYALRLPVASIIAAAIISGGRP